MVKGSAFHLSPSHSPTPKPYHHAQKISYQALNEALGTKHDYSLPSTYMVTVVTAGRRPLFGTLTPEPYPHIEFSPLGLAVARDEIAKISVAYPNLRVRRYCIMPDHIHIVINVMEEFAPRKDGKKGHLGYVISGFKAGCLKAYKGLCDKPQIPMFEEKYHDRIIMGDRHYETWKRYLDDNPRRLAIKHKHPDYFTVIHDLDICGHRCQITGNRFLLDIPDKMAVIVHRADSNEAHQEHRRQWLACGERGDVLASASIAPREKEVMREAMNRGYNIILLRDKGFPKPYKPSGESFDACADGRLLQISPCEIHSGSGTITRAQCLYLNRLAEQLVNDTTWY